LTRRASAGLRDADVRFAGADQETVMVESIELLGHDRTHFVRTRATNGAMGFTPTKQIEHFVPIFEHMVAPHFIGKDARDSESLIDAVHVANYKDVALPSGAPSPTANRARSTSWARSQASRSARSSAASSVRRSRCTSPGPDGN
jgi:hypothetical protein